LGSRRSRQGRHCEGCSEARVQHHSLPAGASKSR
jgi:hypothetical protein